MRKRWMPPELLRDMAGVKTLREIAEANEAWGGGPGVGWLPTRPAVSRQLRELDLPSRRETHSDLIPWHVLKQHKKSRWYKMLQAVDRARKNEQRRKAGRIVKPMSDTDQKAITLLYDLLSAGQGHHKRGIDSVVGYCPHHGFYRADRRRGIDFDIIREPDPDDC